MQPAPAPPPESPSAPARSSPPHERARRPLLVLALLVLLLHAAYLAGWIIDDAYVSFRYAHNLVEGRGLVFNPGDRVEGYTNFSWTILAALCLVARIPPEVAMPAIGLAAAVGLLLFVAREGRRLADAEGQPHPLAGVPAAFVLACSTGLALYAVCGLEMAFFSLLLTAAAVALVSRHARTFALLTALAFLTRPEAGLLGVVGLLLLGSDALREGRRAWRRCLEAAAILALLVGPYLAFKLLYFGSLVPNTLVAKTPDLSAGLSYAGAELLPLSMIVVAAVYSAWKSERARRDAAKTGDSASGWSRTAQLLAIWSILVLAVVLVGGDFMPAGRMLLPSLSLVALAADRALLDVVRWPRCARDVPKLAILLGALAYPVFMASNTLSVGEQGALLAESDLGRRKFASELVQRGVRSVGTFDVGLISYVAPDIRILDLGGLTDRIIARAPGYYWNKEPPADYLRANAPDAFVFTSLVPPKVDPQSGRVAIPSHYVPEDNVKAMPWFVESYSYVGTAEVLAGNYYLHWFARKGSPGE